MEKNEFLKNFSAGVFFFAGIVLAIFFIFAIGKDKGFSEPKFQMSVLFGNVGGLSDGAPIRLSGVNVGNVDSIDFLDQEIDGRRVKVTVNIFQKYRNQLNKNVKFSILTEGILGEKLIEISVIDTNGSVDMNVPVIGEDPLDVSDLAETFTGAAESFTETSKELSEIDMVEFARVMEASARALLITSEGLNTIMGELHAISIKSKRILDRVEQKVIDGDLFKVF